jgi:hypothetical protein
VVAVLATVLAIGIGASVLVVWPTGQGAASSPDVGAQSDQFDVDVSFDEYQAGFWAWVECAETAGWIPVEQPRLTSREVYNYQFYRRNSSPAASAQERQSWERDLFDCRAKHFDPVQWGWERKMTMPESERQEARNTIGSCLRDKGFDAPAEVTSADIESMIRVVPGVTDPAERQAFNDCASASRSVTASAAKCRRDHRRLLSHSPSTGQQSAFHSRASDFARGLRKRRIGFTQGV